MRRRGIETFAFVLLTTTLQRLYPSNLGGKRRKKKNTRKNFFFHTVDWKLVCDEQMLAVCALPIPVGMCFESRGVQSKAQKAALTDELLLSGKRRRMERLDARHTHALFVRSRHQIRLHGRRSASSAQRKMMSDRSGQFWRAGASALARARERSPSNFVRTHLKQQTKPTKTLFLDKFYLFFNKSFFKTEIFLLFLFLASFQLEEDASRFPISLLSQSSPS